MELIKQNFEGKKAHSEYTSLPKIPIFSVPDPHEEPRFSCFSDPEVTQVPFEFIFIRSTRHSKCMIQSV